MKISDDFPTDFENRRATARTIASERLPEFFGRWIGVVLDIWPLDKETANKLIDSLLSMDPDLPPRGPDHPLNTEVVRGWAVGTLEEWLEGWTQADETVSRQYRVRVHDDGTWVFEPDHYTSGEWPAVPTQRFKIDVTVTEVPYE